MRGAEQCKSFGIIPDIVCFTLFQCLRVLLPVHGMVLSAVIFLLFSFFLVLSYAMIVTIQ